jgi:tRNA 2-selenouridine synthase
MEFQTTAKIDIVRFMELSSEVPVVDVRSPSEFRAGHIPGSFNIPLFDDAERKEVGTTYTKEGRQAAIITGLKLTGPSMHSKLEEGMKLATGGRLLVHCWRGGMRSEAMAWLFSQGGIGCELLHGGYKSYRHLVLSALSSDRQMIILGGLTGSGKTRILGILKEQGYPVIDLEGIANHKGSAFGSLGQLPQPSSEQFANLLFSEWRKLPPGIPVWLEDESINIGNVFMPREFYLNMQKNPAVILLMDIETRLKGLVREYSGYPAPELEAAIMRISRRLGGDRAKEAVNAVRTGDIAGAVSITLKYYDKAYMYGLSGRQKENTVIIKTATDDPEINAGKVLEASRALSRIS